MGARIAAAIVAAAVVAAPLMAAETTNDEAAPHARLVALVGAEDAAQLLQLIAAITPPQRIRELATLDAWQAEQGGGFYGLLPQPAPQDLPVPVDPEARLAAALLLAQRRQEGLAALTKLGFPVHFGGEPIPASPGKVPPGMHLTLDVTVVAGFVDAMADGRVDAREAAALAALPANREMLRHRRELGYIPDPLPSQASLARMIARAGSRDPVDRLWCWLAPESLLGYADLATNLDGYRSMVAELRRHRDRLESTVVARLAPYLPAGFTFEERFALTVGALIRGWTTAEAAGLNVEQLKDDWPNLLRTMSEEVYHRLQLRLLPHSGARAASFDDLVIDLGDPRASKLYEAMLYSVLEGTANLAAGPARGVDDPQRASQGAELLARFVREVLDGGRTDQADALIGEGLRGNGPLYAIGYRLASIVAAADGTRAVPALLRRGPVAFALRAQAVAPTGAKPLPDAVVKALRRLPPVPDHG